ncbi:hypothetical protein RDI58_006032 [Solanum bulbocastanum]|uniref:Uncharacterized protein n=1 Tax=Solanum bulbocastanum TaxID=147425 RepID=A0AAN8U102_SOLBU
MFARLLIVFRPAHCFLIRSSRKTERAWVVLRRALPVTPSQLGSSVHPLIKTPVTPILHVIRSKEYLDYETLPSERDDRKVFGGGK